MYLKNVGLKEQLLDAVDDLEFIIKQILEALYIDKKLTDKEIQEKVPQMVEQYNEKQRELGELLSRVEEHQAMERYIRELEKIMEGKDNLIGKMATELKIIENSINEATFQAEKKLHSVKQSEANRVFSEDVIRFGHLISKHHSVSSPAHWKIGDPLRPFPIEANFSCSALLLSRTQAAPPFLVQGGQIPMKPNVTMFNMPGMPPQQKPFTPNSSRLNMFPSNMGSPAGTGSPRGRPPGGGARMSSPSPRSFPKILQRNSSQQSPRFPLIMPGQHPQMSSPSQSGSSPMFQIGGPGFMSPTQQMMINFPPNMKLPAGGPKQMTAGTSAAAMATDIPIPREMSSTSSSSSSDDEM